MNWDWLYTLYSISSAFLIITFSWKVIEKGFQLIALLFNDTVSIIFAIIYSAVPYYFNATFSALTVYYVGDENPPLNLMVIAGLFLLFNSMIGIVNTQRQIEKNGDYQNIRLVKVRYAYLVLELVVFTVSLINIEFTINMITVRFAEFMNWIQGIAILNVFIAIFAFLNAVYIIFMALSTMLLMIVAMIKSKHNLEV